MIDTLSIADDLTAAGIEWEHAKAQAKAIARVVEQQQGEAASKADASSAEAALCAQVAGSDRNRARKDDP